MDEVCTCHQLIAAVVYADVTIFGERSTYDNDNGKFCVDDWPELGRYFGAFRYVGRSEVQRYLVGKGIPFQAEHEVIPPVYFTELPDQTVGSYEVRENSIYYVGRTGQD